MNNLSKYSSALNDLKEYLQKDLQQLDIEAAQIYGSVTYDDCFVPGTSDIDVCIYTSKMKNMDKRDICKIISNSEKDFIDKSPTIMNDHIADRIEFYIDHPIVPFDITILAPELPRKKEFLYTSSYDSMDMIIGALYQRGIPLFGTIPDKDYVSQNFYPFYPDDIRNTRLDILGTRIEKYANRVEQMTIDKSWDLFDHLYKLRLHFLKWLFIYKREYPVNLQKHLEYQFNNILKLPKDEIDILAFTTGDNLFEYSSKFLELMNYYMNEYKKENHKTKVRSK